MESGWRLRGPARTHALDRPSDFSPDLAMHERELVVSGGFEWATQLRHFKRLNDNDNSIWLHKYFTNQNLRSTSISHHSRECAFSILPKNRQISKITSAIQ